MEVPKLNTRSKYYYYCCFPFLLLFQSWIHMMSWMWCCARPALLCSCVFLSTQQHHLRPLFRIILYSSNAPSCPSRAVVAWCAAGQGMWLPLCFIIVTSSGLHCGQHILGYNGASLLFPVLLLFSSGEHLSFQKVCCFWIGSSGYSTFSLFCVLSLYCCVRVTTGTLPSQA